MLSLSLKKLNKFIQTNFWHVSILNFEYQLIYSNETH